MRKVNLWKNRTAIKLYAFLAILLIIGFQCYWLKNVYESGKSIIVKESENILKTAILESEHERMKEQLTSDAFSQVSESNESLRALASILKNIKDANVIIDYQGEALDDKAVEKLAGEAKKNDENKAKAVYKWLKIPMKSSFENLEYSVSHFDLKVEKSYPILKSENEILKTDYVYSDSDAKQSYRINYYNLPSIVINDMIPTIILSFIYMGIYISAIILLIFNVNKSRKLMHQKDNFTNNMTHEFKTPMSTISAAIEALNKYDILDDKEMAKEYLALMKNDLDRLIKMTDSILYNAKTSDGNIVLQLKETDLHLFVSGVVDNLKTILENKKANVTVTSLDKDLLVNVDAEHFGNVFRNLIDNSIKYSEEDPEISISIQKKGNLAKILFTDNGIGIPDKYKSEIFKSYFRIVEKDMYTIKGYGLGLSYVKEIIRLHKGKIQVEKNTAKGTTFEILIPLANE